MDSKVRDIWNEGIGSVSGSRLTFDLANKTANDLANYSRKLEAEIVNLKTLIPDEIILFEGRTNDQNRGDENT